MYKIIGNDQNVYGPASAEELRQWIREGRANGQSQVQADGAAEWRTLETFPDFAAELRMAMVPPLPPAIAFGVRRRSPTQFNGMAVAGFVFGLLSVPCCCFWVFSVLGLIFSLIGLKQLRRNPQQPGRGLALTGLILSLLTLLMALLLWKFFGSWNDYAGPSIKDYI